MKTSGNILTLKRMHVASPRRSNMRMVQNVHPTWLGTDMNEKGYTVVSNPSVILFNNPSTKVNKSEQNAIGFSVVAADGNPSNVNLDRLDPMFMYTQIIKEILLEIQFKQKHRLDFIQYCRESHKNDTTWTLNKVQVFEDDYHSKTPIWWYTRESFLYSMLNRALRLSNIDVIIKIGFFIRDLHRQIEDLYEQQYSRSNATGQFIVYRGQGMSKEEFEKISKAQDGLISFNNFLSTSATKAVATVFAESVLADPELVAVLFEMEIHPKHSTTPFASIAELSCFAEIENEILFAMHTVFRIREIQHMAGNTRFFRVKLELTSDKDKDLHVLTERIREETFADKEGWERLAEVLLVKLDQPVKAQEIYQMLLYDKIEDNKKGKLYNRSGLCKLKQGQYKEAIPLYEKSIEMYEMYSPKDLGIAWSFSNLGLVYSNMCEYKKAFLYYEKALVIRQQSLSPNHPDLASSYNNIGNVYYNIREYENAFLYYEKAFAIRQQSLLSNHPDLATSYNNIGLVYNNMGEFDKALSSHEKAFLIRQRSLPPSHPDLAYSYNNIGSVYENMKLYPQACVYYEKAVEIAENSLPPNHSNLQEARKNFERVKNKKL